MKYLPTPQNTLFGIAKIYNLGIPSLNENHSRNNHPNLTIPN
jgi:hypothetical protein